MAGDAFLGLPIWLWGAAVIALVAVAVIVAQRRSARANQLRQEEDLAQKADAAHEGARTRHGGGP